MGKNEMPVGNRNGCYALLAENAALTYRISNMTNRTQPMRHMIMATVLPQTGDRTYKWMDATTRII